MNTTYFKNTIMGKVFGTSNVNLPSHYFIGLSSTAPTVGGTNVTEPSTSGTGYARVRLDSLSTPVDGVITNNAAIIFPESTADWFISSSPAAYYVIYDSDVGGNLLMYNALTHSRIIEINTVATIQAGSLVLQLTD